MLCPKCHRPLADESDGLYICCAGESMRWRCVKCAKISEGFAIPYGRCPKCAGSLVQLDAPESVSDDESAVHAIRLAFEIELGGRNFYQRAAATTQDDELRALFTRFAVMEGEHMETLSRRYHLDVPDPSDDFRIEVAAIFADVKHRPLDPANLFSIAISLEKRAAGFFESRAGAAAPGSTQHQLFLELAAEEREHAELLETELRRWRERRPGIFGAIDPQAQGPTMNAAAVLLAGKDPTHCALECGSQRISYGELAERVARAAGLWQAKGVRPGDRVAIKLPDGIDWVIAYLGTIWAGAVAVGVNPQVPAAEWQYILDEAGFNLILAESAAGTPAPWDARVVRVDEGRREILATAPIEPVAMPEDAPALWCHSSGTTGKPKAIVHGQRFAREVERVSRERLGITAEDRLFPTSKLFFAYPQVNCIFAGLKIGATIVVEPAWPTPDSVVATIAAVRPTVLFSVPSMYRALLQGGHAEAIGKTGVRLCVSAGEAIPPGTREAWRQASGVGMADGYGASEVMVLVLTSMPGEEGLRASPGIELTPVDAAAAATGVPTRLMLRTGTTALGYLDRPAAQADSFRDGAFCAADLFVQRSDGSWRFAGREDALIKIKGRWVNLVELEAHLAQDVPGLVEAAAVCVPDEQGFDTVVLFYAAAPGQEDAVLEALRARAQTLPPHHRPTQWRAMPQLPRTVTGKLMRRQLAELKPA